MDRMHQPVELTSKYSNLTKTYFELLGNYDEAQRTIDRCSGFLFNLIAELENFTMQSSEINAEKYQKISLLLDDALNLYYECTGETYKRN